MVDAASPFRKRLETAAVRLDELASRSAPMVSSIIKREAVAVRNASELLEGTPCWSCNGTGRLPPQNSLCGSCKGTGDL
jgi:hypothetical protein